MPTKSEQIQTLRQALRLRSTAGNASLDEPDRNVNALSTGFTALDTLLPDRGLPSGSLVEWLSKGTGTGAFQLSLLAAHQFQQQGFTLVILDPDREFYPPGADQLGIDLRQTIVVRPGSFQESLWTWEQTLRSEAQVVVVGPLGRLPSAAYRRLKLATETSSNVGLFLRPAEARIAPSWADFRLLVEPMASESPSLTLSRRLRVSLLSARGRDWERKQAVLDIHNGADSLSLVPRLAGPKNSSHLPRAS